MLLDDACSNDFSLSNFNIVVSILSACDMLNCSTGCNTLVNTSMKSHLLLNIYSVGEKKETNK